MIGLMLAAMLPGCGSMVPPGHPTAGDHIRCPAITPLADANPDLRPAPVFGPPTAYVGSTREDNGRDFVTRTPPEGPFRHVGARRSIDPPTDSIPDAGGPAVCRGEDVPAESRNTEDARYDTAELISNAFATTFRCCTPFFSGTNG